MTAVCCPLSECDDYAEIYEVTRPVARKEYACEECRGAIPARTTYQRITMKFDGDWSTYALCALCSEIGDHFSCGYGRVVGTLWSDLEENFFPDMKAGGPCMQGLSVAAKQFLIDARMEWYFDQDECNDSIWKGWTPDKPPTPRPAPPVDDRERFFDVEPETKDWD